MSKLILFFLSILLIFSCQNKRSLEEIKQKGELRILITNSPITYYEDRDGNSDGFEYEMLRDFTKWLQVEPKFIVVDNIEEIFEKLKLGKGDIAAAGLSITDKRKNQFLFSPPYQTVKQTVICHNRARPKKIEDLARYKIIISSDTSYEERLENFKKKHEKISWVSTNEFSPPQIFQKIKEKKFDCTVMDSNIISVYHRYFPTLRKSMELGDAQKLAWAMRKENKSLQKVVKDWFDKVLDKSQLRVWKHKYYAHLQDFDPYDIKKFKERIKTRLPKYINLFKEASKISGWSWQLLAAISYQESHWDPRAKSHTGVRGLMMLTRNTAKSVGVKNRLDPKESIMGGARYLKRLEKRIPRYIPTPDRMWMTLAAYNVGFAHLRDARGVAAWQNKNPNRWAGVREALPLLSKKSIYRRLPHGYARGVEPVIYINRIRNYYDLLMREL